MTAAASLIVLALLQQGRQLYHVGAEVPVRNIVAHFYLVREGTGTATQIFPGGFVVELSSFKTPTTSPGFLVDLLFANALFVRQLKCRVEYSLLRVAEPQQAVK